MWRPPRRGTNVHLNRLVRETSLIDLSPLAAGIFALFALLGVVIDILSGGSLSPGAVVRTSLLSGLLAAGYAIGAMRRNWWLFGAMVAVQVVWFAALGGGRVSAGALGSLNHLRADGIGVLALMIVAYTMFLAFINFTASNYMRVRTEIELAHEIHQVLVPVVERSIGGYDFYGVSRASGQVGGDLVDVVPLDEGWFGYVADVSGHGVSSGVVMGMFKSALRMRLRQDGPISSLLDDLNSVLHPLKSSAMYVTVACVRGHAGGALEFAVAGHLPILRTRGNAVEEITTPQIPIGMFEDYRFTSAALDCAPGDLLALLTDGLIEVFDRLDRELGLDAIKALLASSADRPLREIADAIVSKARAHGAQLDDQTVLLVRRS
jgi:sigma-B regulation protein RsbU (phosphoserine phosphatase)